MNEHRLPERLINYWNTLRKGDESIPDFNHFNASTIADIWQQCVLFTVAPSMPDKPFVLSFYQVGDRLRTVYSKEMEGRTFNTAQHHFQGAAIVRRMEETIQSPAVLTDVGQFVNERGKIVKYRSCLLPFGKGGNVTHVIVGISWKEY